MKVVHLTIIADNVECVPLTGLIYEIEMLLKSGCWLLFVKSFFYKHLTWFWTFCKEVCVYVLCIGGIFSAVQAARICGL